MQRVIVISEEQNRELNKSSLNGWYVDSISPDDMRMYRYDKQTDNYERKTIDYQTANTNPYPFYIDEKSNKVWIGKKCMSHRDLLEQLQEKYHLQEEPYYSGRIFGNFLGYKVILFWNDFWNEMESDNKRMELLRMICDKANIDINTVLFEDGKGDLVNLKGKILTVDNETNKEQQRAIHLASQEEKREKLGGYLSDRSKNQSEKLSSNGKEMTRAEYNALRRPFSESKKINNKRKG